MQEASKGLADNMSSLEESKAGFQWPIVGGSLASFAGAATVGWSKRLRFVFNYQTFKVFFSMTHVPGIIEFGDFVFNAIEESTPHLRSRKNCCLNCMLFARYVWAGQPSPPVPNSRSELLSQLEAEGGDPCKAPCLEPPLFKGAQGDGAGLGMAGGHTDGKVCSNPFITLQILVLLAFAAAIFLLGNWWSE